jgi:hypothetical protein
VKLAGAAVLFAVLAAACGGSGETETVEVTTTVNVTTTVQAQPTSPAETETLPMSPGNDPDDVPGQLDIRNVNATRSGDLIAVSVTTYEPWSSNVLVGSPTAEGPNRLTIFYDADLDGSPDYRGRIIFAGGQLSLFVSGSGSEFEPVPVERPNSRTAQFVHLAAIFFQGGGGSSDVDMQIRARSIYNGEADLAPDSGHWLGVPFNP